MEDILVPIAFFAVARLLFGPFAPIGSNQNKPS